MRNDHFRLSFNHLHSDSTLHQIRHFVTYLTKSTVVLSSLQITRMHYDGEAHTLHCILRGPEEHVQRLFIHMQTFFSEQEPRLEKLPTTGDHTAVDPDVA